MRIFVSILLAFGGALAPAADLTPHYFWVMFGTQVGANTDLDLREGTNFLVQAAASHTFGTFVEIVGDRVVQESTISWLPARGYFGDGYTMPWLKTVPGHNYSLDETLRFESGKNFRNFGPYEITPELYQRALRKVAFLASGHTSYHMLGELGRNLRVPSDYDQAGGAINCIMAFNGIGGFADVGKVFGWRASWKVLATAGAAGGQVFNYPSGTRPDVAEKMHLEARLHANGIYSPLVY